LESPAGDQSFGRGLRDIGVHYVVLTKDTDFQRYDFMDHQAGWQRIYDDEDISLYRFDR